MKKTISLLALVVFLTGCGQVSDNKTGPKTDSNNPIVNERGETYLDKLKENISAFDRTILEDSEKAKVVELEENGSLYYFAADGKRYIFPTQETYSTWYGNFETERLMSLENMQEIPLGGNVTVRPGSLISTSSDPNIYLVKQGAIISAVDREVLKEIFGEAFDQRDIDLPNYYFTNYQYGESITAIKDYPMTTITLTIDQDKNLK